MIECAFTVDYEIYGNGRGTLQELVYEPAERLRAIFRDQGVRFVVFPDVAELEMIEAHAADPMIGPVIDQLRSLRRDGFELGLHLHPWWYNARRKDGMWVFDQGEYNLCAQPAGRINEIIERAIGYLRKIAGDPAFSPLSFRAGHLIFQPTQPLADVLAARGVRLDSSVYKGGLWREHNLDYRRAPRSASYWRFRDDVATSDPQGILIEIPIHTRREPVWKLLTAKRVGLQQRGATPTQTGRKVLGRLADFARFRYPLKFDLGQMTGGELNRMMGSLLEEDRKDPLRFRPVVAIMHTKDPIDYKSVEALLARLRENGAAISTFAPIERKVRSLPSENGARTARG